jgi:DNA-binding response OmpR family regulator
MCQEVNASLERPVTVLYTRPVPGTLLVVDDEPSIRLLCRINLELEGFEVVEAGTLTDARAVAATRKLDAVLLDLHVGHESGRTLLAELRNRTPPVPVALVTGSAELHPSGDGTADATLIKPFTIEQLLRTVRELTATR